MAKATTEINKQETFKKSEENDRKATNPTNKKSEVVNVRNPWNYIELQLYFYKTFVRSCLVPVFMNNRCNIFSLCSETQNPALETTKENLLEKIKECRNLAVCELDFIGVNLTLILCDYHLEKKWSCLYIHESKNQDFRNEQIIVIDTENEYLHFIKLCIAESNIDLPDFISEIFEVHSAQTFIGNDRFKLHHSKNYENEKIVSSNLTFVDKTFAGDYNALLTENDINNILKSKYRLENNKRILTTITESQLTAKLKECQHHKNLAIFFLNLHDSDWVTLVVNYNKKIQDNILYIDFLNKEENALIRQTIQSLDIEIKELKQSYGDVNDSGLFALENAALCIKCNNLIELEKELTKDRSNEIKEQRIFYANMLKEKKKTENKIESCLKTLAKFNSSNNIKNFTYENANTFILFLETFALEDTYHANTPLVINENKKTYLENRLRSLKKNYFTQFYFQSQANNKPKSDITFFEEIRKEILHEYNVVELETLNSFVFNCTLKEFFQHLESYAKYIHDKIKGETVVEEIVCNSFLTFKHENEEDETIEKEEEKKKHYDSGYSDDEDTDDDEEEEKEEEEEENNDKIDLLEYFLNTLKILYSQENLEHSELENLIFDLTVNIIPVLNKHTEKVNSLNNLRNSLIHNFRDYESSRKFYEIKKLYDLRSHLFKYCYSRKIYHDVFKNLPLNHTCEEIKKQLSSYLTQYEQQFKNYKYLVPSQDKNTFAYIFKDSVFPENDKDIQDLVDQYLKFMVFFNYTCKTENIDDEEKREVFESVVNLNRLKESNTQQYVREKEDLKTKLRYKYGVDTSSFFEETIFVIDDQDKVKQIITEALLTLKNVKNQYHFPNNCIITKYNEAEGFNNEYRYSETQPPKKKKLIEEELNKLPISKLVTIKVGEMNIKSSTSKIVSDLLKTFYSSYRKYQVRFDNVEEAFTDDLFLDYLTAHVEIEQKLDYYIIIKKLIKSDCFLLYIAKILIKINSTDVINKTDLKKLKVYLEKKSQTKYLHALEKIDF